jgi:hypothetical protein
MNHRRLALDLPTDAITVVTYEELDRYLVRFAERQLGLVLLLGRPGTGKTETVRRMLGWDPEENDRTLQEGPREEVLYIEGHVQPFGLYCSLWDHRDCPVVLDDLDRLYAHPECVRLLKPLCNCQRVKRLAWYTNATQTSDHLPTSFTTTSNVMLIANEWHTLNANVRALEDRAIILHFEPDNTEVHRRVADWFEDDEVYQFIGDHLAQIPQISMRHYHKGSLLRKAGLGDWRLSLLQMMVPDKRLGLVAALQVDPELTSDAERVARFMAESGQSRPTYYRMRSLLPVLRPSPRLNQAD